MMTMGAQVFSSVCFACHQSEGQGLKGVFPPLAKSDFLMADKDRAISIVMNGFKGEVVVNGETYRSEMPKPQLTDVQIASVLTYVRSSFGNSGEPVTLDDVNRVRAGGAAPSGGPQRVAQALQIKAKNVALRARPKSATPRTTR
jgi:nitrite reductase (NO-forming)